MPESKPTNKDYNLPFPTRLRFLLEEKGKTKYWLYKQMGMSYQNFNRMVTNQTNSIRLSNIETLCMLLECTPNDLFAINWEENGDSGN